MNPVCVFSASRGIPLYGPSGASTHLRGVVRGFQELGHPVHLSVPRLADHRPFVLDPIECPTSVNTRVFPRHQFKRHAKRDWAISFALAKTSLDMGTRPDFVYERYSLCSQGGRQLASALDVPHVLEVNAPLTIEQDRFGSLSQASYATQVEKVILRSADHIIAVSPWLRDWAIHQIGCAPHRVHYVPNGTDLKPTQPALHLRQRFGNPSLLWGIAGSLKPWHGLERIPGILDALPEAHGVIFGTGPVALPKHPRLHQMGRTPPKQLGAHLSALDVGLVLGSHTTCPWRCPLKVFDYRSQGVPIVATPLGVMDQWIEGGGEIVQSNDPKHWAAAIRRQSKQPRNPKIRSWRQVIHEIVSYLE